MNSKSLNSKSLKFNGHLFLILAIIATCMNAFYGEISTNGFSLIAVSTIYYVGSEIMKKLDLIHDDILKNN